MGYGFTRLDFCSVLSYMNPCSNNGPGVSEYLPAKTVLSDMRSASQRLSGRLAEGVGGHHELVPSG